MDLLLSSIFSICSSKNTQKEKKYETKEIEEIKRNIEQKH